MFNIIFDDLYWDLVTGLIGWFGGLNLACGPPVDYIYIILYIIYFIYTSYYCTSSFLYSDTRDSFVLVSASISLAPKGQ